MQRGLRRGDQVHSTSREAVAQLRRKPRDNRAPYFCREKALGDSPQRCLNAPEKWLRLANPHDKAISVTESCDFSSIALARSKNSSLAAITSC